MKTKLIQFGYWILHILWINRKSVYSFSSSYIKAGRFDGKITFEDFKFVTDRFKNDGVVEHKELEEQMYGASVLQTIRENDCKCLYLTEQKGWECVIHSLCRSINYNINHFWANDTKPLLDIDKINQYIKEMATLGIYKDGKGSSIPEVAEFLRKKLKLDFNINALYLKIPFGSDKYKELLDKGYMAVTCGKMSNEYIADFRYEGMINQNYTFLEKLLYSHAFATYLDNGVQKFVDNYKNTFSINNLYKNPIYNDFIKKSIFLPNVYVIVDGDNFDFISPKEQLKQRITYTAKSTDEQEKIDVLKKYIDIGYEPFFQKINSFECIVGELIIAGKINNLKI